MTYHVTILFNPVTMMWEASASRDRVPEVNGTAMWSRHTVAVNHPDLEDAKRIIRERIEANERALTSHETFDVEV